MRIIGFQILSRKESLELSTTLAEARALRMEANKLVDQVKALLAELVRQAKAEKAKKGRK